MNILQGYCLLALTPYIQLLMFYIYYTLKLVKLQILVQHFQCWCYSYPTSTCLTANTLTSARAKSVLTHLIKKALNYPKHCVNNWDAIEDFIYNVVLPKKNCFTKLG